MPKPNWNSLGPKTIKYLDEMVRDGFTDQVIEFFNGQWRVDVSKPRQSASVDYRAHVAYGRTLHVAARSVYRDWRQTKANQDTGEKNGD